VPTCCKLYLSREHILFPSCFILNPKILKKTINGTWFNWSILLLPHNQTVKIFKNKLPLTPAFKWYKLYSQNRQSFLKLSIRHLFISVAGMHYHPVSVYVIKGWLTNKSAGTTGIPLK
jgi:hypothetical protein